MAPEPGSLPLTLLTLLSHALLCTCLPDGPPMSACLDMKPGTQPGQSGLEGHTTAPQNLVPTWGNSRLPPYYIQVHGERYTPNEEFKISIVANQTTGLNMYKGVIMQAHRLICASNLTTELATVLVDEMPLGEFSLIPKQPGQTHGETLLKTMKCYDIDGSAVSHKSPQFKINETVKWQAPDEMIGHIIFRATIVQYAHIYWTDVWSPVLLDPSQEEVPTCAACTLHTTLAIYLLMLTALLHNYL